MSRVAAVVVSPLILCALSFGADPVSPATALELGPLASPTVALSEDPRATTVDFVPELPPAATWPVEGDPVRWFDGSAPSWRSSEATDGRFVASAADGPTLRFIALYASVDRYGRADVVVEAAGAVRLFVDGEDVAHGGAPGDAATELRTTRTFRRGMHRLLLRIERSASEATSHAVRIEPSGEGDDAPVWSTSISPLHAPADYHELREVHSMSGLRLSPDGALLAVRRTERGPGGSSWSRLDVVRVADGQVVAASLGGAGASAVEWREDGWELLLRVGDDLLSWNRRTHELRRLLEAEPGLGAVSWSDDGDGLVFTSTRGVPAPKDGAPVRRTERRERLTDWPVAPHLWHLVVSSGARRRLAVPGDWVQDAFGFRRGGRSLVLLRSRPTGARPWFETEVLTLDLATGAERSVATLAMGFENRPGLSGFAVSPDGSRIAFVGPPSELGVAGAVEPNAFDPDLFVLDLESGAWTNVTGDQRASVDGHLRWTRDGTGIRFLATAGSRQVQVFARLEGIEVVAIEEQSAGGERVHDVDFAGESSYAAVVSRTDRLPWLVGDGRDLALPNLPLEARWVLPAPEDQAFAADDGTPIEAWLYRPIGPDRGDGKLPLVVYYYGGASPTTRGWNELHAYVVANGYALYVVNPRGAHGYGAEFANHHVNDWGEKAGSDILRGVEDVLARNDDLDPTRVGAYGGSYGGFMTMSLVARSDRFAAAVSLYGISNLASYWGDGLWGWTYGDQAMATSYPWSHAEWYTEHSPLFNADRIHTPLLLLHGDQDGNVPPAESEQMFTALRALGREVELVRFAGEDHGLRGTWENRVAHREMMLEWFDAHLRDRPTAWKARWE